MFLSSLSKEEIGLQVANLLNSFNLLGKKRTVLDICEGRTNYIIETNGKFVAGAIGLDRQSYTFTEIKHLVVHPAYRRKGIAKYLVERAMKNSDTKLVFATVREDNHLSLDLFESLGFIRSGGYKTDEHNVILLVRMAPRWEKEKPQWKSSLLLATAQR